MNNQETQFSNKTPTNPFKKDPKRHKKLIIILLILGALLLLLLLASSGFLLGNHFGLLGSNPTDNSQSASDSESLKQLYDELITSYVASGKSDAEIIALLEQAAAETGDQSYISNQESYLVKKPSFNLIPGSYQGSQTLTINKHNPNDTITYTLDVSSPTSSSTPYTDPITLPIGTTTVKAVAISNLGILSAVTEGTYTLTESPSATESSTPAILSTEEFIDHLYGVWYDASTEKVLIISETNFYDYIPSPLSVGSGAYVVVSTTANGGSIIVKDLTVEGSNLGDTLVNFDFGVLGDNKMSWQYDGKTWYDNDFAEYLGSSQYRIPFLFAGNDIFTMP